MEVKLNDVQFRKVLAYYSDNEKPYRLCNIEIQIPYENLEELKKHININYEHPTSDENYIEAIYDKCEGLKVKFAERNILVTAYGVISKIEAWFYPINKRRWYDDEKEKWIFD